MASLSIVNFSLQTQFSVTHDNNDKLCIHAKNVTKDCNSGLGLRTMNLRKEQGQSLVLGTVQN